MPDSDQTVPPRAHVDHDLCVGVGECIRVAPRAFRYNKERLAIFRGQGEGYDRAQLQEAVDSCPMQAISIVENDAD